MPILPRRKVKTYIEPALVGSGTILASCPGIPILAQVVGETAVEQGRYADPKGFTSGPIGTEDAGLSPPQSKGNTLLQPDPSSDASEGGTPDTELSEAEQDVEAYGRALIAARDAAMNSGIPPLIEPPSPSLIRRNTLGSTDPSSHQRNQHRPASHRRASSSKPHSSSTSLNHTPPIDTTLSSRQSLAYQSRLLRSHYLHSEVQFLQTLSAISLVIPLSSSAT